MAALSNYLEAALLNHVLRDTPYTAPSTVYVALFDADDGLEAGTLTGEVTGGSYARQAVAFDAPSAGAVDNTGAVTFTGMPAVTVTHVALMDGAVEGAGNVLFHGPMVTPKTVGSGDTFSIAIGDLVASLA